MTEANREAILQLVMEKGVSAWALWRQQCKIRIGAPSFPAKETWYPCQPSSLLCSMQSAIKGLTMGGLEVISITDNTPIPHNGCRPKKARRL